MPLLFEIPPFISLTNKFIPLLLFCLEFISLFTKVSNLFLNAYPFYPPAFSLYKVRFIPAFRFV